MKVHASNIPYTLFHASDCSDTFCALFGFSNSWILTQEFSNEHESS